MVVGGLLVPLCSRASLLISEGVPWYGWRVIYVVPLSAAGFHARRARSLTLAVLRSPSTGIDDNLPFSYRGIFGWPWGFGNSYCTLLSPSAGEARPAADFLVLALMATRRRGASARPGRVSFSPRF